ncbi:hypothetical protein M513_08708 [Trichuris suis]|uniref:Uncharacterized protein n=1 Tax=Trichuris suis TaxID=68888 RepID=A0A085LZT5_9BILA|nr:hypothetical protein M513_08708 [Trichuris suis]
MNKQLQSNELNLTKTKLMLFKCNFARGEFCQFPTLAEVSKEVRIPEDDVHIYCQHLEMLHEDFLRRFDVVLSLVIPNWVLDPFIVNPLNEELIDLQSNEEIKPRMEREIALRYPALWAAMKRLLITIPSSSVVESGFSVVTDLMTKKRSRPELVNRGIYDGGSRQCGPAKICCEEARGSNNAVGAPASNPSRNSQYEELAGERTAVLGGDFPPIFAPSADMFSCITTILFPSFHSQTTKYRGQLLSYLVTQYQLFITMRGVSPVLIVNNAR